MRTTALVNGEIYHVCNRAVEGRNIFINSKDCRYFVETVLLVNTTDTRHLNWRRTSFRSSGKQNFDTGKSLVDVYAMSLMPNHFHMLLKQNVDKGTSQFLLRLCNSYGKFYNQKYKRKGTLFMGRFKAVLIKSDSQAAHIFSYIHGNPLDLIEPDWREGRIKNWNSAKKFLANYQWSSLNIYTNGVADSLIQKLIKKEFAENYYSKKYNHLTALKDWSSRSVGDIYLEY